MFCGFWKCVWLGLYQLKLFIKPLIDNTDSYIVTSYAKCNSVWVSVDDAKCIVVMAVCVCVCLCMCVCLSLAACSHYCTDPDISYRNGRGAPSCALYCYWADLQSVHAFRCYANIAWTRNVSECFILVLCGAWLVYWQIAKLVKNFESDVYPLYLF